jgi:hypothetical protein
MERLIMSNVQKEMPALVLNLVVTLCSESTGLVHGIALRYALASVSAPLQHQPAPSNRVS